MTVTPSSSWISLNEGTSSHDKNRWKAKMPHHHQNHDQDLEELSPKRMHHHQFPCPISIIKSLGIKRTGPRAAVSNATGMAWQNLGLGMGNFGPTWLYLESLTNAVMEQSCDWLHLFGRHWFNSLGAGRTMCSWVLWVVTQCLEEAIVKTHML